MRQNKLSQLLMVLLASGSLHAANAADAASEANESAQHAKTHYI